MNLDGITNVKWCQQHQDYVHADDMSTLKLRNMTLHLCSKCKARKLEDLEKERNRAGNKKLSYFI